MPRRRRRPPRCSPRPGAASTASSPRNEPCSGGAPRGRRPRHTEGMPLANRLPPALQRRDYALFWAAILVTGLGSQMVAVAVGWQVYSIRRSAFDLGLIGLAEFLPLVLLALPAGQLADRASRKTVLALSLVLETAVCVLLVGVSAAGAKQLWPFLVLAALGGVGGALWMPAGRALPATLVPLELIPSAIALRTIAFQAAVVAGP